MTQAFLALDTGGTRTTAQLLVQGQRSLSEHFELPGTLSGYLSPDDYESVLRGILAPLETFWREHDLRSTPLHLFISSAGFAAVSRDAFERVLREVLPSAFGGAVTAAGMANDAVALLLGSDCDGILIAGTGSNVMVTRGAGTIWQAGGHDWVASDAGSGFWLGLSGVRQVARDFEANQETPLLRSFRELYEIPEGNSEALIAGMRKLAIADSTMKAKIARFAPKVLEAADRGDIKARNIVDTQSEELAALLVGAATQHLADAASTRPLRFVLVGGVIGNPSFRSVFERYVQTLFAAAGSAPSIEWQLEQSCLPAALNLAQSLAETEAERLLEYPLSHRPVLLRFAEHSAGSPAQ